MEVQLGVGAIVDIATGGELDAAKTDILGALAKRRGGVPRRGGVSQLIAASPTVVRLATIATGKIWDMRSLSIVADSGNGPFNSPGLNVVYFASSVQPSPNAYDAGDIIFGQNIGGGVGTSGYPFTETFSKGQQTIRGPRGLWVFCNLSPLNASVFYFGFTAVEIDDTDEAIGLL